MNEQMTLDDLTGIGGQLPGGMVGRMRPAISEAEVAACCCPDLCMRDHENE